MNNIIDRRAALIIIRKTQIAGRQDWSRSDEHGKNRLSSRVSKAKSRHPRGLHDISKLEMHIVTSNISIA